MILLEDKLTIFNKIVYQKNKEICLKKINEAKKNCQEIEIEKKAEIAKTRSEIISRREKLAKQKSYEMLSNVNEEKRILELEKGEELLRYFINDLYEKLEEFTKTDDYFKFEENNLTKIIDDLDQGTYIISILKRDEKLKEIFTEVAGKKNIKLNFAEMDESFIGGFMILDKDNSYNIDCSLKARVDDSRYEIGKLLHFTLKKEVGGNN